ncbi:MAG: hypothetical protein DHS20C05_16510 [Hyphococcus sp.]|nr:MAG: hypothetical protein DHS20C05_16510 [Marinicaulis sp.]
MSEVSKELDLSMDVWQRLFVAFDTSPERYPVHLWRYEALDIWPIVKTQFMLRACNLFHADKSHFLTPSGDLNKSEIRFTSGNYAPSDSSLIARPPASKKNDLPTGVGRTAKSFRPLVADVLFWGSDIGRTDIGDYGVMPLIDPFRIVLEEAQIRTTTLLVDVAKDDPSLNDMMAGGAYGFRDEFNKMRTAYTNGDLIDFEQMDGFSDWFAEMNAIWPIECLHTRTQLSSVIAQTQSCYQILLDYYRIHALKGVAIYAFYGPLGHASAAACRDIGIPCMDIQHGVAGSGHESYHWPNMPVRGYNTLPTHFLTWTDVERQSIAEHAGPDGPDATTVGHTWRLTEEIFRLDRTPIALNQERYFRTRKALQQGLKNYGAKLSEKNAGGINILVSLYTDQDIDWLKAVIENSPADWRYFVRLHPGEAKRPGAVEARKTLLGGLNAEVETSTHATIPELMPHMNMHLTKYSSTVIDALAYGVPSVCFSESAAWFYPSEDYKNVIVVENNPDEIVKALETLLSRASDISAPQADLSELQQTLFEILGENPAYGKLS